MVLLMLSTGPLTWPSSIHQPSTQPTDFSRSRQMSHSWLGEAVNVRFGLLQPSMLYFSIVLGTWNIILSRPVWAVVLWQKRETVGQRQMVCWIWLAKTEQLLESGDTSLYPSGSCQYRSTPLTSILPAHSVTPASYRQVTKCRLKDLHEQPSSQITEQAGKEQQ